MYSANTGYGLKNASDIQINNNSISGPEIRFQADLPVNDYSISLVAPESMDTQEMKVFVNDVESGKEV